MSLPGFSVKRKVTITMLILIVVVMGVISYFHIGLDLMPNIEYPQLTVITNYSGASPKDVEQLVSKPIEAVVSSVSRVKKVKSISQEGLSIVTIELEWGTNLDAAAQDVRDRIARSRKYIPQEADDPIVYKFNLSDFPVLYYGVKGKGFSQSELKKLLDDEVVERLSRLDGVATVHVLSPTQREVIVEPDLGKLASYKVGIDRIIQALRAENINQPAGYVIASRKERDIRIKGQFNNLGQIRNIVVGVTKQGKVIHLNDVAGVSFADYKERATADVNGEPGVVMLVNKNSSANTVIVARRVKKELEKIKKGIPSGIEFHPVFDQEQPITLMANRTISNIMVGGILAIIILFMFLGNWRPTLVISLSIPLSIIVTFIAFYAVGYTLNMLTLSGLALGVGMLVDNSVVVIENTYRHFKELGKHPDTASAVGTEEVAMAITASTLTTIAVFFPMMFASGITGQLSKSLALSISFALLASLFVALTITPMLTSILYRRGKSERKEGQIAGFFKKLASPFSTGKMRGGYEILLRKAMRVRGLILLGVFLLFIVSFGVVKIVGTEFMPKMDRPSIVMKIKAPVGTPLEVTNKLVRKDAKILASFPETISVLTNVGTTGESAAGMAASEFSPAGANEGVLWAKIKHKEDRKRSSTEIMESLRSKVPSYRGVENQIIDVGNMMMGGSTYPVEIEIYGKELGSIHALASRVEEVLKTVKGMRDINMTYQAGKPEIRVIPRRDVVSKIGLSTAYIGSLINSATSGELATRINFKGDNYDVRVQLPEAERENLNNLLKFPIMTPGGGRVFISDLVNIENGTGPVRIYREGKERVITVRTNIVGVSLGQAVSEAKRKLEPVVESLPSGYSMEFGGQYKDMMDSIKIMIQVFLLAALLVYMVMAAEFEHLTHPLVIMFTIPLAIIGVFLGLLIAGKPLSLPVLMGAVMLGGIAVNNGIVMIDYINQLIKKGKKPFDAVIEGAGTRLRPVLITALTTVFGTLPMAISSSTGSEFRSPLGIAIVGGLTVATFLTLFIVPIVYSYMNRIRPE